MKNRNNGTITTEFCLSLPLLGIPLFGMVLLYTLRIFSVSALHADAFFTARAQLYGNSLSSCRPSKLWPNTNVGFSVTKSCSSPGKTSMELKVPALIRPLNGFTLNAEYFLNYPLRSK